MSTAAAPVGNGSSTTSAALTGKLASAASIAGPFQSSIAEAIRARKSGGKKVPKLVGILATPSPPSVAYAQWTKKACEQVGIEFEIWQTWSDDDDGRPAAAHEKGEDAMEGVEEQKAGPDTRPNSDLEADVEDLIIAANADDAVHGIMVYYPIFGGRQDTYLQQIVDPRKDVEGLHFSYCFNMYHNIRWIDPSQLGGAPGTTIEASAGSADNEANMPPGFSKSILPCTPLAVVKCLEGLGVYDGALPYGDRLFGKTITVVNRSEVVGRPLAALLSNDGAQVYSVDLDSVQEFNKRAEHEGTHKPSSIVQIARQRNASHRLRPHHVVRQCQLSLQQCLAASDVIISGVPAASFKIQTSWIKDGAVTVNFSSEKNFEKDVRSRASVHLPAIGKTTIAMLQRNLLRLVEYRELAGPPTLTKRALVNGASGHGPSEGDDSRGGSHAHNGSLNGDGHADGSSTSGASGARSSTQPPQPRGSTSNGQNGASDNANGVEAQQQRPHDIAMPDDETQGKEIDSKDGQSRPSTAGPLPTPPTWPRNNAMPQAERHPFSAARERAGTMTNPMRSAPFSSHVSPPYPTRRISHAGNGTTSGAWDWRSPAGRHDSVSSVYTPNTAPGQTPPFGASSSSSSSSRPGVAGQQPPQSPLLFAPIGSSRPTSSGSSSYFHPNRYASGGSGAGPYAGNNQSSASFHSASSPRSATPVSPLIIDGLSVEDSGSSNPTGPGSQRHSWDSGPPRTPNDVNDVSLSGRPSSSKQQGSSASSTTMPSVLIRPEREEMDHPSHMQQGAHPYAHHAHLPYSPLDEKMALDRDMQRHSMTMTPSMIHQQQLHHDEQGGSGGSDGQALTSQLPPANQSGRPYPQDRIAHSRRRRRPPFSYSSLIAQAIASAPEGRMTLREIYTWISNAYPDLYSMEGSEGSGWQNTVRHNLSLNKAFIKVARTAQDIYDSCSSGVASMSQQARGKGGWWMLDPNVNPATIGATPKNEGEEESDALRLPRRRRTDSTANSVISEDDMMSPATAGATPLPSSAYGTPASTPSVLQQHQQQRGRAYTMGTASPDGKANGAPGPHVGMPSVLRGARSQSVERAMPVSREEGDAQLANGQQPMSAATSGPVGARLIAGRSRPRGYTTSSADMAMRGFAPPPPPHAHGNGPMSPAGSPPSPFGYAPSLPSPAMYNHPLSPYTPSQGPAQLAYRYGSSPSLSATRSLASNPPTPAQATASLGYPVNSPQKRKIRFGEGGGQPATNAAVAASASGAPTPPAFYPRGEESRAARSSPSYGPLPFQGGGGSPLNAAHPLHHQQPRPSSMIAPSPLSGRAVLPSSPTPLLGKINGPHNPSSATTKDELSRPHLPHVRSGGATIESDEANGSRMSITGLLNV